MAEEATMESPVGSPAQEKILETQSPLVSAVSGDGAGAKGKKTQLLIVGGTDTSSEVNLFDLETKKATKVLDLPFVHVAACAVEVGGKVYCLGGGGVAAHAGSESSISGESESGEGSASSSSSESDIDMEGDDAELGTNNQAHVILKRGEKFALDEIKCMKEPRLSAGAAALNDQIYICGGVNEKLLSSNEVYSIENNNWNGLPDLDGGSAYNAVVSCDGRIYCLTGGAPNTSENEHDQDVNTVRRYDPASNKWERIAPMNCTRVGLAAAVVGNTIYAIGGTEDGKTGLRSCEKLVEGKWEMVKPMNKARHGHAASALNDKIFVIGGMGDEGAEETVEEYDPKSDEWTIFCTTDKAFWYHSLVAI